MPQQVQRDPRSFEVVLFCLVLLCLSSTVLLTEEVRELEENPGLAGTDVEEVEENPEGVATVEAEEEGLGWFWERISGYLLSRYRVRFTDDDEDHEFFQYGSLNVGDPYRDKLTFSMFGRLVVDLDGHPSGILSGIRDTYTRDLTGKLYHAYLGIHRVGPVELLRLGRQFTQETPEFAYFDGAHLQTRRLRNFLGLRGFLYGGLPVHPYESSRDGDQMVGAALESNPWHRCKLRLDWMHVRDDFVLGTQRNDLFAATIRQIVSDHTSLYARWTGLEEESRDVTVQVQQTVPDWDLEVTGSYRHLFTTLEDFAIEFDPYFAVLREYRPYLQGELRASKLFGEHFGIEGGVTVRELNDGDESPSNHEFVRYFLYPSLHDWPLPGLDLTLFGDVWDSHDDQVYSVGGEMELEFSEQLEVSVGTAYELYRWDFYRAQERDRVRTYYGKIDWHLSKSFLLGARYEFEDSDFNRFHTFEFNLKFYFGKGG